jgi:hypothetical protein
VGAEGSSGGQEHQVDALAFEALGNLGAGLLGDDGAVAQGAHEGVVVGRNLADLALLGQLAHPVDGEGDVDVPVDGGAVEADAEVARDDIGGVRIAGDDAVGGLAARMVAVEGLVVAQVQPGGGDDGDRAVLTGLWPAVSRARRRIPCRGRTPAYGVALRTVFPGVAFVGSFQYLVSGLHLWMPSEYSYTIIVMGVLHNGGFKTIAEVLHLNEYLIHFCFQPADTLVDFCFQPADVRLDICFQPRFQSVDFIIQPADVVLQPAGILGNLVLQPRDVRADFLLQLVAGVGKVVTGSKPANPDTSREQQTEYCANTYHYADNDADDFPSCESFHLPQPPIVGPVG